MSLSRDIATAYVALIKEGNSLEDASVAVCNFIKENDLWSLKDKIVNYVEDIEREKQEYNSVDVVFAEHSEEKYSKDVAMVISESADVDVSHSSDPKLIAGFKARYRGREWDASIAGVLERLRVHLKTN